MCRLFGVRADHPIDLRDSLTAGPRPFHQLGEKHPHGWGIGWYHRGRAHARHEALSAANSTDFTTVAARVRTCLALAHVRRATCGAVTAQNCHPFRCDNWLFAHNGSLDRESLLARLNERYRATIRGQTDSEVFFHWLLQNIEQTGSVAQGLRQAIAVVGRYTALNFVLTDGKTLYAYRDAAEQPAYYSLFYLQRMTASGKALLVCSERLTDEVWEEIPLGSLLAISSTISPELLVVR
jgi:predicted glutamine amidotransferase